MEPKTPPLPIAQQIAIAQEMLPGMALAADGRTLIGPCPYEHRSPNGPRHYKIWFSAEQGPHDHCVHASCRAAHDTLMSELYRRLAAAARKQTGSISVAATRFRRAYSTIQLPKESSSNPSRSAARTASGK